MMLINAIIVNADEDADMLHLYQEFVQLGVQTYVQQLLSSKTLISIFKHQFVSHLKDFENFETDAKQLMKDILEQQKIKETNWAASNDPMELTKTMFDQVKQSTNATAGLTNALKYLNVIVYNAHDMEKADANVKILEKMLFEAVRPSTDGVEVTPVSRAVTELRMQLEAQQVKLLDLQKEKNNLDQLCKQWEMLAGEYEDKIGALKISNAKALDDIVQSEKAAQQLSTKLSSLNASYTAQSQELEHVRADLKRLSSAAPQVVEKIVEKVDDKALVELKAQLAEANKLKDEMKSKMEKLEEELKKTAQQTAPVADQTPAVPVEVAPPAPVAMPPPPPGLGAPPYVYFLATYSIAHQWVAP